MINYRFYWLLPDGRIDTASNLEFADDGAARAHAERIRDGAPIEVWQGARKVFQIGLASPEAA
jgi:hypothetical protein